MIAIEASEYFLPALQQDQNITNDGKDYLPILSMTPICLSAEIAEQFITHAVEQLMQKVSVNTKKIVYIIHAYTAGGCAPLGQLIVRKVAARLAISATQSFATNINKCVSIYAALEMAESLLENAKHDSRVLIITGEIGYSPKLRLISNGAMIGDAAGALLISKKMDGSDKMLQSFQKILSPYVKGICMSKKELLMFDLNFISLLGDFIMSSLGKSGLTLNDIRWIVPHNIHALTWLKVGKYIGMNTEKIFLQNFEKFSHCFNSDFIINHKTLIDQGLLSKDDYYLCAAVGVDTVLSSAVFQH